MKVLKFPSKKSESKARDDDHGLCYIADLMLDVNTFAESALDSSYAIVDVRSEDLEAIRNYLSAITTLAAKARSQALKI